ncbi:MAG: thiamine pyrophosphate-dependent dehydrogenase E1 component subunit alpha [Acidobacteriia bacterium]|nr:thiamine pyrophosphate-dependent dehydrogenase E1 component subunit alpha [Terriglobia bacterium]
MRLNRAVDERLGHLYRQGKVVGGLYSSLGQEAISVGTAYALEKQDILGPMIRNLGSTLVRGFKPRDIFCQYMARAAGPTHGRDCNLHFGDLNRGVMSCISMLGALIPVMSGIALSSVLRKENRVALTYIGDGGTRVGDFHEGLNFAATLNLPLVVIVENNQYAYSTPVSHQMRNTRISDFAAAYGIPGETIDGNDVLKVYSTTKKAVERARKGGGPSLIECETFRMKGHAEHDDAKYVPSQLVAEWRKKDPLARFEKYLQENGLMTPTEQQTVIARITRELDDEVAFAEASPLPDEHTELPGVYAD